MRVIKRKPTETQPLPGTLGSSTAMRSGQQWHAALAATEQGAPEGRTGVCAAFGMRPRSAESRPCAVTVVARITNQAAERLEQTLSRPWPQRPSAEIARLLETERVHFLSYFVTRHRPADGPRLVVLELNADGTRASARRLLCQHAPDLVRQLFGECERFPRAGSPRELADFVRQHDLGADALYVGCPDRSVRRIHHERALRERLRELFHGDAWKVTGQRTLRDLSSGLDDGERALVGATPKRSFWVRWGLHPLSARRRVSGFFRAQKARLLGCLAFAALLWTCEPIAAGLRGWLLASEPLAFAAGGFAFAVVLPAVLTTLGLWWGETPVHARRRLPFAIPFLRDAAAAAWRFAVPVGLGVLLLWLLPFYPVIASLLLGAGGLPALLLLSFALYVAGGLVFATLLGAASAAGWLFAVHLLLDQPLRLAGSLLLGLALASLALGVGLGLWLMRLRCAERSEVEGELSWDLEELEQITKHEDHQRQNHLATCATVKHGRLPVLRIVLRAVSLLSKVYFNHGDLAGIPSIHFGRFVIVKARQRDERHRLLFLGNYDGGFGAYLGAFAPVPGVTAVWSNTEGFPRTEFLVGAGARDEQRFKAFARRQQAPTLGWFSAYEQLSVQDIDAATALREALAEHNGFDPETETGGLHEAASRAALRRLG